MRDVNWWLMVLAFVLGLLLTFALMIRRVTREVPVTHAVSAGVRAGADAPKVTKSEIGKVAGAATAAGAAVAAGAAAKLHSAAAKVEHAEKVVEAKVDSVLEKDPYGTGSIRVSARTAAPSGYTIKGDKDTGRYFTADSPEYEAIEAEVWFANEASAEASGFLRWDFKGDAKAASLTSAAATVITSATGSAAAISEVPAGPYGKGSAKAGTDGSGPLGWLIKGNADSMLYHGTDSPAYEQTIAEVWFFDEDTAKAAGFDKWDKNFT